MSGAVAAAPGQAQPARGGTGVTPAGGSIALTVTSASRVPVPDRTVQLRDLSAGDVKTVGRTNADGEFRFEQVVPGQYIVELIDEREQVQAVSGTILVVANVAAVAEIILPDRRRPGGAFFWKSSTAILTAAAVGGVLGIGAVGRTASPER